MKKILIIQTAFLGDVILATSLLEKLHHEFPDASIDFLLRKGNEGLFEGHPFINKVLIWERKINKYSNLQKIIQQIRRNKYDLLINLHRFGSSGILTIFSKAKQKIGFTKNPFSLFFSKRIKHIIGKNDNMFHEIDRNLMLVSAYGNYERFLPRLYPSSNDYDRTEAYRKVEYICIAPTSVWFTKQFPKEKWIEFINSIDESTHIYLLGSAVDQNLCNKIINETRKKNLLNFAGELNLLETAGLMKYAKMNFVNDSAPLHIASAMNAAVTAIFCSTVPSFGFGPLSEKSIIIQTNESMECRPCGLHGFKECPEKHFECAYSINKEKLINAIL